MHLVFIEAHKSLKIIKISIEQQNRGISGGKLGKLHAVDGYDPKFYSWTKENSIFSWESSAGLIPEKINNWSVEVKRRHPNI